MRKLVIVYNPRSSRHTAVESEVLDVARAVRGYMVTKFQVRRQAVLENARLLAKILSDGDLVVAAGGDGTATMAANGVIFSGKNATLAVLGYGNFNDVARMYGISRQGGLKEILEKFEQGATREVFLLEVRLDGELWRYAPAYVTVGMLAESTAAFEDSKVREKLRTGKKSRAFSVRTLARWYFRNRKKKEFLAKFFLNGEGEEGMTDYIAVNSPRVAGMMRGGKWYSTAETFGSVAVRLSTLGGLMRFMTKSILSKMPLVQTRRDEIVFDEPTEVMIQAEGEYEKVKVGKIEVSKGATLKVVA